MYEFEIPKADRIHYLKFLDNNYSVWICGKLFISSNKKKINTSVLKSLNANTAMTPN